MSNNDYKLILVSDNTKKIKIRYRKKNDTHWNTLYSKETDIDKAIDSVVKILNGKS